MNLKEVRQRILSVKGTRKITSAMKMVSSAKLHRAQAAIDGMRPYARELGDMLSHLLASPHNRTVAFTEERQVRNAVIVAVASDKGMCGSFNSNVVRQVEKAVKEYSSQGIGVEILCVGKRMLNAVERLGIVPDESLMQQAGTPRYVPVADVAYSLMKRFEHGDIDRVELIYTSISSSARQLPVREVFLPVDVYSGERDTSSHFQDFIIEPGRNELLQSLLPKVIALRLFTALLNSAAAEHTARMIAMQTATENADDLIAGLTLEYNKGRQLAITSELLDIVAGSGEI